MRHMPQGVAENYRYRVRLTGLFIVQRPPKGCRARRRA
jgi:hypothetical protein